MGDSEVLVYYCKSCKEETVAFGIKNSCPYCKAKKPSFDLATKQMPNHDDKVKGTWYKKVFRFSN